MSSSNGPRCFFSKKKGVSGRRSIDRIICKEAIDSAPGEVEFEIRYFGDCWREATFNAFEVVWNQISAISISTQADQPVVRSDWPKTTEELLQLGACRCPA